MPGTLSIILAVAQQTRVVGTESTIDDQVFDIHNLIWCFSVDIMIISNPQIQKPRLKEINFPKAT